MANCTPTIRTMAQSTLLALFFALVSLFIFDVTLPDCMFFTILPVLTASQQFEKRYYLLILAISIAISLTAFYFDSSNFIRSVETLVIISICLILIAESFFRISNQYRNALKEIEEKQAMMKSILRAAPIGIGSVQDRVILWTNEYLSKMTGYSSEELVNQNARILYPSEEEYIRVGRVKHPLVEKNGIGAIETTWQRKDGSTFNLMLSSAALNLSDLSEGLVFTALDQSVVREAQKTNAMLIEAVEHAAEAIFITNTNGEIQYINKAFEAITGYSKKEAIGQNPRLIKSGKHDQEYYANLWETLIKGEDWKNRIINKRKDGRLIHCDVTISPVLDPDKIPVNYVAVMRDVTREKELEEQLLQSQKLEAVGQLSGGVAHDFNNLLLVINGYSELAKSHLDNDHPIQAHLDQILHAGEQAAAVTRQLLAFSRREVIQPKDIDLNELIQHSREMLKRFLGETIELHFYLDKEDCVIHIDPIQMEQIILNLSLNACDAMPHGGSIAIETSMIEIDGSRSRRKINLQPGEYVLLSISDTGTGIDSETLEHIFEPFFTTKHPEKGTGLGLSTVYGIVKQNNGHISVYSELDRGTTFKLYFQSVSKPHHHEKKVEPDKASSSGTETILLVEDDTAAREYIEETLTEFGYKVISAHHSDEALELFEKFNVQFDLLLTDIILPYMSGKELADILTKRRPELPVLFISGYTANAIVHNGVVDKGVFLLQKPFSPSKLKEAVRNRFDAV